MLSAHELTELWEWGQNQHPIDHALGLLTLATPAPPTPYAALSLGQRNRRLLTLREQLLGPTLNGYAECADCGEKLEFAVEVATLRLPEPTAQTFELTVAGFTLHYRLPNSFDLAAIVGDNDVAAARHLLFERCVLQAWQGDTSVAVTTLPDTLIPLLAEAVLAQDPQAEMYFELVCPACGNAWSALFDIAAFFWTEIGDRVKHILYDVHLLAQAYHWREADILHMSATRRQFYLNLVTVRDESYG